MLKFSYVISYLWKKKNSNNTHNKKCLTINTSSNLEQYTTLLSLKILKADHRQHIYLNVNGGHDMKTDMIL